MSKTIAQQSARYASQAAIDRVAIPLIQSAGSITEAFRSAMPAERPAINYARQEFVYRTPKRKARQMELELYPSSRQ